MEVTGKDQDKTVLRLNTAYYILFDFHSAKKDPQDVLTRDGHYNILGWVRVGPGLFR